MNTEGNELHPRMPILSKVLFLLFSVLYDTRNKIGSVIIVPWQAVVNIGRSEKIDSGL